MGSCDLHLDNHVIGRVSWEQSGGDWIIRAGCGFEDGVIYRAFMSGGGSELALGVMEPKGDRFVLRKAVRLRSAPWLEASDQAAWVTRSLPGQATQAPARRWESSVNPAADALLKSACDKTQGVIFERCGGQTKLYYPLNIGEESVFAPFFSVTRPVTRDGKSFGCITLDAKGRAAAGQ